MARYRRTWNSSVFNGYLKEGRGQGVRSKYKPWICVQNFPSKGTVSRAIGTKTGRIHHLMSNLELSLFYILDWTDDITDIREQCPLIDLAEVISIAETADIKYPYDSRSGFPYVLTSDFYVETIRGAAAISVKPSSELGKPRVREKLEIERRYWTMRGVDWCIMTENEINRTKANNIEWLAQARDLGVFGLSESMQNAGCGCFMKLYSDWQHPLSALFKGVEEATGSIVGMGLNIYKHLAYWKRIPFNVEEKVDFAKFAFKPYPATSEVGFDT